MLNAVSRQIARQPSFAPAMRLPAPPDVPAVAVKIGARGQALGMFVDKHSVWHGFLREP